MEPLGNMPSSKASHTSFPCTGSSQAHALLIIRPSLWHVGRASQPTASGPDVSAWSRGRLRCGNSRLGGQSPRTEIGLELWAYYASHGGFSWKISALAWLGRGEAARAQTSGLQAGNYLQAVITALQAASATHSSQFPPPSNPLNHFSLAVGQSSFVGYGGDARDAEGRQCVCLSIPNTRCLTRIL